MPIYHVAYSENNQLHLLKFDELIELVKEKRLSKETYVWKAGMKVWVKAGRISELKQLFATPPIVPDELKEEGQLFD